MNLYMVKGVFKIRYKRKIGAGAGARMEPALWIPLEHALRFRGPGGEVATLQNILQHSVDNIGFKVSS